MLSWQDPVGEDVWLADSKGAREPAFLAQVEQELQGEVVEEESEEEEEEEEEVVVQQEKPQRPSLSRMQSLVTHLQTRAPALGMAH